MIYLVLNYFKNGVYRFVCTKSKLLLMLGTCGTRSNKALVMCDTQMKSHLDREPLDLFYTWLQYRVVRRYQILGGHALNRVVGTGGAQLHKSQNIGRALARVPTVHVYS